MSCANHKNCLNCQISNVALTRAAKEEMREALVTKFRERAKGAAGTSMVRWAAALYDHLAEEAAALPLTGDEVPAKSILDDPKTWEGIGEQK